MEETKEMLGNIGTVLLIQNDCESIKKLVLNFQDSIFCMQIIPYMALFCRSYQEYAKIELINPEVDSEIYDLRNSIKIYGERYARNKKRFITVDEEQDDEYKSELKFDFLKNMNAHYNLGMYFTDDKKIIGNTQLIESTLRLHGLSKQEQQQKCFSLGSHLASVIGSVSNGLASSLAVPLIAVEGQLPKFLYDDINTNKNHFFNINLEKDENLFLLHMLSNINFVKYVLCPLLAKDNLWTFRIKYISIYHAYKGIEKIKSYTKNNRAEKLNLWQDADCIIKEGENIFISKFRNCMMHYSLNRDNEFCVSERNFSWDKPFFGLIEECFEGMTYGDYVERLEKLGNKIEEFITKQFDFERIHLKKF